MKILITGYKGFIGQNFVKKLQGHELSFFEWGESLPSFTDLDWVIHLGALTSTTERDIAKILHMNLDFSCWVFEQCGAHNVNLQYASSASIYGLSTSFKESGMPDPRSPYAWSKYLFERYIEQNLNKYPGIIVQGFRYFNVYGPNEDHKLDQASPYHKFSQQAIHNKEIILFENSDQYKRDFIPVDSIFNFHQKFFKVDQSGIWNLGTGVATSFQSIAEKIANTYGAKLKYVPMPEQLKSQYQSYTCADLTKLNKTLNEKNTG